MQKYNTRVAPSPTGFFHLGTARTAYHNWLAARASGGNFILRIDDTDTQRNDEKHVDLIYKSLDWLGIDFDKTFRQSDRIDQYRKVAQLLVKSGIAFFDDGAIRLNTNYILDQWCDFYGKSLSISQQDVDFSKNQVLIKSDGYPTYHFASMLDDIDYDVNLIIRGADHISNTPKQLFILKALIDCGYCTKDIADINFIHVGLIMVNKVKLSKRNSNADLTQYKTDGYYPDAILNTVLKLGWAHKDPNFDRDYPLIDKDLAKSVFFDGSLKSANCSFDLNKLMFLNKKYKSLNKKG